MSKETKSTHGADKRTVGTAMLVDDNALVLDMMRRVLEDHIATLHVTRSISEAIELLTEHGNAIDLLVTDVVMPEMSGPALAVAARKHNPDIEVLFISGYFGKRHLAELPEDAQTLAKPFTPQDLLTAIFA